MSTTDDGGPAFPLQETKVTEGSTSVLMRSHPGMTLRDYFAGQAFAGMWANSSYDSIVFDEMAREAYRAADAMLAARKVQS